MQRKLMTLVVIHQHPRVLLGMKKRGFGAGKWNGFGGKVLEGETIHQAAQRELAEECGLTATDLDERGTLDFRFTDKPGEVLEVHFFRTTAFTGQPVESEEMEPRWFHLDEIPFDRMWTDDPLWMPLFFAGKKFTGSFLFDGDRIIEHTLQTV